MTHALVAAKSGWGKSWFSQYWYEKNLPNYDYGVILDYKDEYRGLVKADMMQWCPAGSKQLHLSAADWADIIKRNEAVVIPRYRLRKENWQELAATVSRAVRELSGSVLLLIDEAHFVAPQSGSYPSAIEGVATTGRGEGVSSLWVTQRLARLDETIISQMMVRVLGGFASDADLNKVERVIDYPVDVHQPTNARVAGLPSEIQAEGESIPVRKFEEGGKTLGSEWIFSDDSGDSRRIDSRTLEMESTHYGPEGQTLTAP